MEKGNSEADCLRIDSQRFKVASVVPKELDLWVRRCPGISPILSQDAIDGVEEYATLGVDRALAVRGAARVRCSVWHNLTQPQGHYRSQNRETQSRLFLIEPELDVNNNELSMWGSRNHATKETCTRAT